MDSKSDQEYENGVTNGIIAHKKITDFNNREKLLDAKIDAKAIELAKQSMTKQAMGNPARPIVNSGVLIHQTAVVAGGGRYRAKSKKTKSRSRSKKRSKSKKRTKSKKR